jgi:protoporphyrinogen oxidase
VILGAGVSGLSAAWVLARSGYSVTLLEKAESPGGLAMTKKRGDFEYDLGPHNIHSVHAHIIAFFQRHFPDSFIEHQQRSKVLKRGRFVDYPLRGTNALVALPVWRLPPASLSFILARLRLFVRRGDGDDSFEAWITRRFGRPLFDEYFGPYASKVWGIDPTEIDSYVAKKRVPAVHLTELIGAALFGRTAGAKHPEFQTRNYYLRHGIGETAEFFRAGAEASGARIVCRAEPVGVQLTEARVTSVFCRLRDGNSQRFDADYVLSTVPLNEAVQLFEEVPEGVRRSAAALDYCATVLVFLQVRRRNVLPAAMLYFSDPDIRFSRVSDLGMYSSDMVPTGKTMLCVELPCSVDEGVWNEADERIAEDAIRVLSRCGLLRHNDVEGCFCERLSHSYPRFRVGFQARVSSCFEFFAGLRNFVSFGRQGSFSYQNVDNAIDMGFRVAASVMAAEFMDYTCQEWSSLKV